MPNNQINGQVALTTVELARRWNLAPRTLENWRQRGQGPIYIKLGNRFIRYLIMDVARYERDNKFLRKLQVSKNK